MKNNKWLGKDGIAMSKYGEKLIANTLPIHLNQI